jgi:hypothetical protein
LEEKLEFQCQMLFNYIKNLHMFCIFLLFLSSLF